MIKRKPAKYITIIVAVLIGIAAMLLGWAYFSEGPDLNLGMYLGSLNEDEYIPGNSSALHEERDTLAKRNLLRLGEITYQRKQITYYMKTHDVMENGYDIVSHYNTSITAERDSILHADSVLREIWFAGTMQHIITKRTKELHVFSDHEVGEWADLYADSVDLYPEVKADTLPWYVGDVDPFGVRSGFGVDFTPGKRMRVGEWKNDKYLGERITYSADRIYGIDISRYQHEKGKKRFGINWSNLTITSLGTKSKKSISGAVNYKISFIYIKSTEGITVRNKYFASDYANAKKHGYKVGAYHFFSTRRSGALQAKYFCKMSKYHYGDFPPVLDVEPSHAQIVAMGGVQKMFHEIRAWLFHVEVTYHVKPVLYVSQTFVNRYLPSAPDLMKSYDVWIARYGEYKPNVNLVYWQLCPDGHVKGIKTEVDISVFNGYKSEFEKYGK